MGGGKSSGSVSYPSQTTQNTRITPWEPTQEPMRQLIDAAMGTFAADPAISGSYRQTPIYGTRTIGGGQQAVGGGTALEKYWNPQAGRDGEWAWRIPAGSTGLTGAGGPVTERYITGYNREFVPGQSQVYIDPATRQAASRMVNQAGSSYFSQPITDYALGLRDMRGGAFDVDPRNIDYYGTLGNAYVPQLARFRGGSEVSDLRNFESSTPMRQLAHYGTLGNEYLPTLSRFGSQGEFNPYARRVFGDMSRDVQQAVSGAMNMAGRTGSGSHARIMAEEMGNLAQRINMPLYEAERNRRLAALQSAGQLGEAQRQRAASAIAQRAGMALQGRQAGADAALTALSRAGTLEEAQRARAAQAVARSAAVRQQNQANRMMGISQLPNLALARREWDDWATQRLLAGGQLQKEIQDAPSNARWEALQRAMQSIIPATGIGGITAMSGTGNRQQPTFSNPIGSAIGGALAGSQLIPSLASKGATLGGLGMGPVGAIGGGLLGLLGGGLF